MSLIVCQFGQGCSLTLFDKTEKWHIKVARIIIIFPTVSVWIAKFLTL